MKRNARVGRWSGGLLLIALITAAYARVYHAGFIWDDEQHLTNNPVIVGPLGFADIWTSASAVYYPLVLTTFSFLHKLFGLTPWPYHALNVAWHIASALLLWRVLEQLRVRGAWVGAALWALHPVMVQSVAWITEMKNTQSAFFYMLAASLLLQSRRSKRPTSLYYCALLSFIAAITSKPSTVMLPLVLGLCLWWKHGRLERRNFVTLAPFLLVSVAASVWTVWEQKYHAGATGAEWVQTPLQRLLISADAVWFYLLKLVWPHPLIFIYPRWNIDPSVWLNYLPIAALIVGATVLYSKRRRLHAVVFAMSYFVITLFPVLDFFDVYFFRYSFVSDHFQYLASMGPLSLLGAALSRTSEHFGAPRFIRLLGATACLAILGTLSFHQTNNYRDLVTLYQATLAENPRCWMADYNLGLALRNRGDLAGAIAHYRRAIESHPDYVEAHYNLGGALIEKGEMAEALTHYRRAIELKPDDADSHNNYGAALRQLGRTNEAKEEFRSALSLRPDYLDASLNLASLLLRAGRAEEATAQLRESALLQPNNAVVHSALGNALMKTGKAREAAAEFTRTLALDPNNTSALNSFAWLLATASDDTLRDGRRAVELAQRASEIGGDADPVLLHSLAAAYAEEGRFSDAIATAQRATQLAEQRYDQGLVHALRDELSLYELGFPYRQSASVR